MAASLWWDDAETSNKSDSHNKIEDLLVFGYACKLFRDDTKATSIDNGKLLIPWMGDERLMIDRYDGRGHLYDLASHDADNVEDKNPALTEEEAAVEKACDEERYLELHTDLREAELYEEEEWKRYYLSLQEGYQAVGFSYDQQAAGYDGQLQPDASGTASEVEEKPFVAPEELHVPPDLKIPTCVKQSARIEKTASFIAQHGIQMEIMLKTKQSGNSQFDFLHFDNELNPYYKHVVSMIKSGKYKPQEDEESLKKEEDHSQHYLHPSLSSTALQLPPPPPPTLKPIELPKVSINDTPYGALVQSIRRNTEASRILALAEAASKSAQEDQQTPPVIVPYSDNPPPPGTQPVTLPTSSLNGQAFVDQLSSQPPPPGTDGDDSSYYPASERKRRKRSPSSESSSSSSSSSSTRSSESSGKTRLPQQTKDEAPLQVEGPSPIQLPPPDLQPIIDRMAMYVAKNGVEFEMVVMNRKDPRFQFLNEYHVYYPFYRQMKDKYIQEFNRLRAEAEKEAQDDKLGNNSQRSVSFSIKARQRDQEGGQPSGKARLFEYDSEGEERQEGEASTEVPSGIATPPVKMQTEEDPQKEMEEKLKDKLASALKERISQSHKEKQLQMERKKKAIAFLHLIKSSQPAPPPQPPPSDDLSSTLVEESSTVVYEYNNRSKPILVEKEGGSRSLTDGKRRRRSVTPPSAYNLGRRSPNRPSPSVWASRPGAVSGIRDRTSAWQHQSYERTVPSRKSRSRSPHRKAEKKKKHKRSKSRSPSRKDRHKDKSRHSHSQDKTKHKSKERDKKERKKSKHRSKERESKNSRSKYSSKFPVEGRVNDSLDVNSSLDDSHMFSHRRKAARDYSSVPDFESDLAVPDVILRPSSSTDSVLRNSKSFTQSEGTPPVPSSRPSSMCNSPATHTSSVSRSSTPSHSLADSASADLMSKVRAMLKKSRELILKEEGSLLDDT